MKLIHKYNDATDASDLAQLLENNGVPARVNSLDIRNYGTYIPDAIEVWIYNDSQFTDAELLFRDKNHIVKNKMDIDEFYKQLESSQNSEILAKYKIIFIKYGLIFIFVIFTIIFLAINYKI